MWDKTNNASALALGLLALSIADVRADEAHDLLGPERLDQTVQQVIDEGATYDSTAETKDVKSSLSDDFTSKTSSDDSDFANQIFKQSLGGGNLTKTVKAAAPQGAAALTFALTLPHRFKTIFLKA